MDTSPPLPSNLTAGSCNPSGHWLVCFFKWEARYLSQLLWTPSIQQHKASSRAPGQWQIPLTLRPFHFLSSSNVFNVPCPVVLKLATSLTHIQKVGHFLAGCLHARQQNFDMCTLGVLSVLNGKKIISLCLLFCNVTSHIGYYINFHLYFFKIT